MQRQPVLGLLELAGRVGDAAFAVHLDQLRVPFAVKGVGENLDGLAVAAELNKALCRGAGNFWMGPGCIRKPVPAVAQACGVMGERFDQLALRAHAHVLGLDRIEDLASDQLFEERGDLVPPSRCLQRAKLQSQRCGVHSRLLAQ